MGRKSLSGHLVPILLAAGAATLPGCMASKSALDISPVNPVEAVATPEDYRNYSWQDAIKRVVNPTQAVGYVNSHLKNDSSLRRGYVPPFFCFGPEATSFKYTHERGTGNCFDRALCIASLLSDNGYEPLVLDIVHDRGGNEYERHSVFLFRTPKGFSWAGTVLGGTHQDLDSLTKEVVRDERVHRRARAYLIRDLRENSSSYIGGEGNQESASFRQWTRVKD